MRRIISQQEKFTFKIIGVADVIRARDKDMFYFRFNRQCCLSYVVNVNRHLPEGQYFNPQLFSATGEYAPAFFPEPYVFRKKQHTHSIFFIGRQMYTESY